LLFNSLDFAIFLPVVFTIYWLLHNNRKIQNFHILIASYIFYAWWDWRFLSLIILSTTVDFTIGLGLGRTNSKIKRKFLLISSLVVNLGILGIFKYFNFFIENISTAFSFAGVDWNTSSLNIILPVGISFYTFQTLSYTIDIYKRELEPSRDIITFATFVSFFPQLVAGPIERATNLLPQFKKERRFNYKEAADGLRQILWGLFKKVVIADNCAQYANYIFENSSTLSGSTQLLGALFFTFQIYGDFSGYSDIAIGTAKLFGFKLMQNFAFPYFSRDIAEFWRRWHISLSTWFRDYLYIPLGGSKGGTFIKIRNTFIIFIVSGFWHGANWTFIIWGALNAVYFLPLLLSGKNRQNIEVVAKGRKIPGTVDFFKITGTFFLTVLAWIFFRAENVTRAFSMISDIFSNSFFTLPFYPGLGLAQSTIILIVLFICVEWVGRDQEYGIQNLSKVRKTFLRWGCYSFIVFLIGLYMFTDKTQFIYFDF
jgi:alginate O-acetyltransferase complex protein AlgI